jgi:tripartite-type tricarboxylate transporter receptor subunit TctC
MARPYATAPGVPPERVRALQGAFCAVHAGPQFLDEAHRLGIHVSPVTAAEIVDAVERMAQAPAEVLKHVRRLIASGKGCPQPSCN